MVSDVDLPVFPINKKVLGMIGLLFDGKDRKINITYPMLQITPILAMERTILKIITQKIIFIILPNC